MGNIKHKILSMLAVFMLVSAATANAAQISRTPWEMNRGASWSPIAALASHGQISAYANAAIPATTDANWGPAPDPNVIGFSEASIIPGGYCLTAVDYTYFQTFVSVPVGTSVSQFTIDFSGIDDGGRVTVFNSAHPGGIVVPGSYVFLGGTGTANLASYVTTGQNRIVVTQVDDCPTGNNLRVAKVVLNGLTVKPPTPGVPLAWGQGLQGQLGNGANIPSNIPVQASGLTGVVAVAAGQLNSLALKSDGTVWAWGTGYAGQLGSAARFSNIPVQVRGLTGVISVANGFLHSLALKSDGTVWAWGANGYGQLGNGVGRYHHSSIPVQVRGLTGVVAVAVGSAHSLALKSDGTVWVWGQDGYGQLGDGIHGAARISTNPVQVGGLTGVIAVASGDAHSLALKSDGTVWAWGHGVYGQLGNGGASGLVRGVSHVPVQVSGLTGVAAVAAGRFHSLAVKSDGTVWAWGYGQFGQLGNGANSRSNNTPVQVSGLTGAIAVAGGQLNSLALKSDGTVWAWGGGALGNLGNGANSNSNVPVQVSGLTGAIAVSAGGGNHSLAIRGSATNQSPIADAGAAQTVESTGAATAVTVNGSASSDPDGDALTYTWSWAGGSATGATPTVNLANGTYTITLTVDDGQGHTDTATTSVTVQDTIAPAISIAPIPATEATSVSGAVVNVAGYVTTSDVCAVSLGITPAGPYALGNTAVTVTATDCANNSSSTTTSVTVVDTTAPVLTVPANVSIEANGVLSTVALGTATATDIFGATVANNAPAAGFPLGTTTVTYTATDGNGLTATGTQTVTVVDTTAPVLTVPADVSVEANAVSSTVAIGSATATDIFAVTITSNAPATYPLGATVVTWTATDANGNISTATQTVTVVDTTAPVLNASLTPFSQGDDGNNDDDEGRFTVQFAASDIVDANPVITAVLIINGHAIPVAVTNNQLIEFEYENEKTQVEVEKGVLEIEAPSMLLRVTATDASGNSTVVQAVPVGLNGDNDNESDTSDD